MPIFQNLYGVKIDKDFAYFGAEVYPLANISSFSVSKVDFGGPRKFALWLYGIFAFFLVSGALVSSNTIDNDQKVIAFFGGMIFVVLFWFETQRKRQEIFRLLIRGSGGEKSVFQSPKRVDVDAVNAALTVAVSGKDGRVG